MKNYSIMFQQNMGLRNHYYHFFYGIYLPACEFLVSQEPGHVFSLEVESCGEMNRHLYENPLLPHGCSVVTKSRREMRRAEVRKGLDVRFRAMSAFFLDNDDKILPAFSRHEGDHAKTLLIDRVPPSDGTYKGQSYGATRRWLANMSDVASVLGVEPVAIDNLSVVQQAALFRNADTIVAQHGAALANLYFCRPGTKIIEIGAGRRRCYNAICSLRGLRHAQIDSWPKSDGKCFVDPERVMAALNGEVAISGLPSDEIAARLPDGGTWAEVGVLDGMNAARVLRSKPSTTAYLVDLWTEADRDSRYRKSGDWAARMTQAELDAAMHKAVARTSGFKSNVMRQDSAEASAEFADESLDLVYIDADHTFDGVTRDIAAWWPKVRHRGWIGGHDYGVAAKRWGVKRSVHDFAARNGLSVERGSCSTWFCRKT